MLNLFIYFILTLVYWQQQHQAAAWSQGAAAPSFSPFGQGNPGPANPPQGPPTGFQNYPGAGGFPGPGAGGFQGPGAGGFPGPVPGASAFNSSGEFKIFRVLYDTKFPRAFNFREFRESTEFAKIKCRENLIPRNHEAGDQATSIILLY